VAVGHGEGAVQRGGGAEGFPVELKLWFLHFSHATYHGRIGI
jgi:hypothetical protein